MSLDILITAVLIGLSVLYMANHIRREIRASAKGKCGSCPLNELCDSKSASAVCSTVPIENRNDSRHKPLKN